CGGQASWLARETTQTAYRRCGRYAEHGRHLARGLRGPSLAPWAERLPFQMALDALERLVDVVIGGVAGAGVGLGQGHLVVDLGVLVAQPAAARRTGPPRLLLAEPAQHRRPLRGRKIRHPRRPIKRDRPPRPRGGPGGSNERPRP